MKQITLTCDVQSGVPAEGYPGRVPCQTPVHPHVGLLTSVHHPEEEEGARGQHHAVGRGPHEVAVLVPLDVRGRVTVRFAVEGGGVMPRHAGVHRVLGNAGSAVVLTWNKMLTCW